MTRRKKLPKPVRTPCLPHIGNCTVPAMNLAGSQRSIDYNKDLASQGRRKAQYASAADRCIGKSVWHDRSNPRPIRPRSKPSPARGKNSKPPNAITPTHSPLKTARRSNTPTPIANTSISRSPPCPIFQCSDISQQRETDQLDLDRLIRRTYGKNSPIYQHQQLVVAEDQRRVQDYAKDFLIRHPMGIPVFCRRTVHRTCSCWPSRVDSLKASIADESKIAGDINDVFSKTKSLRSRKWI